MTITILPDNEIRFNVGADTVAVAGLVYYEPEDHAQMDVVSKGLRFKCPESMLPQNGAKIWAVTMTAGGCFWAYDLHTVKTYLQS